jgi:Mrp family chromosome partitioning ATPase
MPPVLMSDDVIAFAPQADGVLLVVSELSTERAKVEKARAILEEMNILGVVLNRSSERNDAGYY